MHESMALSAMLAHKHVHTTLSCSVDVRGKNGRGEWEKAKERGDRNQQTAGQEKRNVATKTQKGWTHAAPHRAGMNPSNQ